MKIDKTTQPLPASQIGELAPKSANAKANTAATTPNTSNAPSSTSVHLGSSSVRLHNLENGIASTPVVDKEKVEAIKKAISEGRFQVNSAAIADGLLDSVKELINAQPGINQKPGSKG